MTKKLLKDKLQTFLKEEEFNISQEIKKLEIKRAYITELESKILDVLEQEDFDYSVRSLILSQNKLQNT